MSTLESQAVLHRVAPERPVVVEPFPMPERLIITIDGPAGCGKTSVALRLAKHLGVDLLDTGAMYRSAALVALETGLVERERAPALVEAVRAADLHFVWSDDPPTLKLGTRNVMERIRDHDVTKVVSPIAGSPELRAFMVEEQRRIARERGRIVCEGRDQGSVVFPDADAKVFLDASVEVRAERRASQLRADKKHVDIEKLRREIAERDASDKGRAVGPLICPKDAWVLDTSHMTRDQVVERLEHHVRDLLHSRGKDDGLKPEHDTHHHGGRR
jgi:CMP/dCMP kinase